MVDGDTEFLKCERLLLAGSGATAFNDSTTSIWNRIVIVALGRSFFRPFFSRSLII
jgi:hypothetical protein